MNNENNKNHLILPNEFTNENSCNNSEDDEKNLGSPRLISLKDNEIKQNNNKIIKKNTNMSSNVEEIEETDNEKNENKFICLNMHLTDNSKTINDNNNDNNDNNENNNCNISENLLIAHRKHLYSRNFNLQDNDNDNDNVDDRINNSMNHKLTQYNEFDKSSINKPSSFSPNKKRRKIVLEEKIKYRGRRRSLYAIDPKEEQKEENKTIRKDKNGTEICKKNKKKVKIGFETPFANVIPIESFKQYNIILGLPKEEKYYNGRDDCKCCSIF